MKIPMAVVIKNLHDSGFLTCLHDNCEMCLTKPNQYENLKACLEKLMDQGVVQLTSSTTSEKVVTLEPYPNNG